MVRQFSYGCCSKGLVVQNQRHQSKRRTKRRIFPTPPTRRNRMYPALSSTSVVKTRTMSFASPPNTVLFYQHILLVIVVLSRVIFKTPTLHFLRIFPAPLRTTSEHLRLDYYAFEGRARGIIAPTQFLIQLARESFEKKNKKSSFEMEI